MNHANTNTRSVKRTLVTFGMLTLCLIAGVSSANAAASPVSTSAIAVSYGDLNLQSEQGNQELYARIVSAARQVCETDNVDIRDLQRLANARACEADAISAAVQQVHSAKLAALNSARATHG
jgi:UrcA family protein